MWDRFVDLVTIIWLGIFFANIFYPDPILANIEISLLAIFVADLEPMSRKYYLYLLLVLNRETYMRAKTSPKWARIIARMSYPAPPEAQVQPYRKAQLRHPTYPSSQIFRCLS